MSDKDYARDPDSNQEEQIKDQKSADVLKTYEFGGKQLYPFSAGRQAAAQLLGLRYGSLSDDDIEKFQETSTYDGIMMDAIFVVYLCTLNDVKATRSFASPGVVRREAMQWAEENNVSLGGSENFRKVCEIFGSIMSDLQDAIVEPEGSQSDEDSDSSNLGGKPAKKH